MSAHNIYFHIEIRKISTIFYWKKKCLIWGYDPLADKKTKQKKKTEIWYLKLGGFFLNLFQEFEINTPDFEASKIWVGNLGKTATHALVYAQLYTADGQCHGLHSFVVPIRDANLRSLPGVVVGDMGEKIGLNGIDNGYVALQDTLPLSGQYGRWQNEDIFPIYPRKEELKFHANCLLKIYY